MQFCTARPFIAGSFVFSGGHKNYGWQSLGMLVWVPHWGADELIQRIISWIHKGKLMVLVLGLMAVKTRKCDVFGCGSGCAILTKDQCFDGLKSMDPLDFGIKTLACQAAGEINDDCCNEVQVVVTVEL